jgi:hypothetical protein
MTENKALKRAVRARMAKTGERYAAARRRLVEADEPLHLEDLPQPDARLREKTGRGWREWLGVLDDWGARERRHGEIASHLQRAHGVPGWWAQTITVGYERARGLRAKHQTLSGSFQVSVSKTFPVGAAALFRSFAEEPERDRWLEPGTLAVRTAREAKSVRFDFRGGASRAVAYVEPKGEAKATVTVQHEKLPDAGSVEEMRAFWRERLERLATVLSA